MRTIDFRMDVLRGGVPYTRLIYEQPPTVLMNRDANIKMSVQGTFLRNEQVDYIGDELRPMMIVNGREYPLGVYRIVTRLEKENEYGVLYDQIEGYDRAVAMTWAKLEQRDFWAAGTSYDEIIANYLTRAGIRHVLFTSSGHVLQSDREDWDIGTPYLSIVNKLLAEINYQSLWFDVTGAGRVAPYIAPSASNIIHTYGAKDGVSVLRPGYTAQTDLYAKPNVFIVILENPEYETPMVKVAVNDSPYSRLSTIRRGIRIPSVYKVDNIASEQELQAYANKLRDEAMQTSENIQIETVALPGHNVGDVIALALPEINGIFSESQWSITMQAGQPMRHELQRTVIL